MYTFIQHAHIKMFKSERKGVFNVTKDLLFQINAVNLTLYSSKNPEKNRFSQKYEAAQAVFNIDNNKHFSSSKSAY